MHEPCVANEHPKTPVHAQRGRHDARPVELHLTCRVRPNHPLPLRPHLTCLIAYVYVFVLMFLIFARKCVFFITPPPFLHPLSHQRNQEVFSTRRPHTRPHRCCGAWLQPTPVCQCAHCPLSRRSRARLLGFQTGATFPSPPDPGARRDAVHTCVHAGLRRGGRRTRRRTTTRPPGWRSRARSLRFRTGAPAPTRLTMS